MKRYLLDTGIMGDFINHRHDVDVRVREERRHGARVGTCLPVVAELFYGAEFSASRDKNLKRIRRSLTGIVCWPFERPAAEEYGRIAAHLRRIGRTIQQNDIQIAAIALALGSCIVVSNDGDLVGIPGLTVENWVK